MFWALVTRLQDLLSVIGFGYVIYWFVRAALWVQRKWGSQS